MAATGQAGGASRQLHIPTPGKVHSAGWRAKPATRSSHDALYAFVGERLFVLRLCLGLLECCYFRWGQGHDHLAALCNPCRGSRPSLGPR